MRALGLDVGSKTIGLALSDEGGLIASPLETLDRRGTARDVEQVTGTAKRHGVTHLVAGLPLDEEGNVGTRAERVLVLVEALRAAGWPVDTVDESFTTVRAEQALLEADLSRSHRKAVVDKVAAALILQAWLDQRRHP